MSGPLSKSRPQPSMARADVESICASRYESEAAGREQAAIIEADGWPVEHHFPPKPGKLLPGFRVASVFDWSDGRYVGDVWFAADGPGTREPEPEPRRCPTCGDDMASGPDGRLVCRSAGDAT